MSTQINFARWAIGTVTLGSILTFGIYGVVVHAQTGQQPVFEKDTLYIQECGACHLAYPPGLLPEQSWAKVMSGLADHFGENAELDAVSASHISNYLTSNALEMGKPTPMSEMLRNMPADPPLRITEFPAFNAAHEVVAQQLDMDTFPEGFLSPCADCHRQAGEGVFEKDRLHPGYGPSVWGGGEPSDTE
jgi:hypothetical protein